MLARMTKLIDTLVVYPERMKANLDSTGGLVFSGQLLLDLVEHGISREDAYRMVQTHAMRAWKEGLNFRELVVSDPAIAAKVPRKQLERAFDLKRQLRNVDKIFARVFGNCRKLAAKVSRSRQRHASKRRRRGSWRSEPLALSRGKHLPQRHRATENSDFRRSLRLAPLWRMFMA